MQGISLYSKGLELLDGQQLNPLSTSALDCILLDCLKEILANITMCSPFVHLLVAFYRWIQSLLLSLGTLVDGDWREGDASIVCHMIQLRRSEYSAQNMQYYCNITEI